MSNYIELIQIISKYIELYQIIINLHLFIYLFTVLWARPVLNAAGADKCVTAVAHGKAVGEVAFYSIVCELYVMFIDCISHLIDFELEHFRFS